MKNSLPYGKRLPSGRLEVIIGGVTSKHSLDSSDVCQSTIRRKETRFNNAIITLMQGGHILSITKVENELVGLIIQIARIRYPMTPSNCLQLANDFVSETESEKDVIEFKNKYYLQILKKVKYY